MPPSKENIEEFKAIYRKKTGKKLENQEAYEMASNLLRMFEMIYRPMPKTKGNKYERKN
jgi:hypothetical protein